MRRVVVTGMGVISPAGETIDTFWNALIHAQSCIAPLQDLPSHRLNAPIAAQVRNFRGDELFGVRRAHIMDRASQFAVAAARKAAADADLIIDDRLAPGVATVLGSGGGGMTTIDEAYQRLYGENAAKLHPSIIPKMMISGPTSQVSIDLGAKGPAYTVASACASGTHAVGQAFNLVRSGAAEVAIAGGSEASLTIGTLKAWEALRILSHDTCRPFSKGRSGLVLGEGAAILILESIERASARGAHIYAEVRGFGMTSDARDILAPSVDGAARAMTAALRDADLNPEEIDYINAHGTGTTLNDRTETKAIHSVFGPHAGSLLASSNKGVLGHTLGAAGAFEAIATALALDYQIAPPTANFVERDPECDIDVVPNAMRPIRMRAALSNSFAFGGLNAVLALSRV